MINSYKSDDLNQELQTFRNRCHELHHKKFDELFLPNENDVCSFKYCEVKNLSDLEPLRNTQGVYIIFSNCKIDENDCNLSFDFPNSDDKKYITAKAIYRGEGSKIKDRIVSHLFNSHHRQADVPQMDNCMEIELGEKGINVDSEKYKKFSWYLIVIRLAKSKSLIRKFMEEVFDERYGRPFASRENVL